MPSSIADDVKLEDLAGATLDTVSVDWRNAIVLITFLNVTKHNETCAIRAAEFSRIEIPRSAAASKLVKSASRTGDAITITMESGDAIMIHSLKFAIDVFGG